MASTLPGRQRKTLGADKGYTTECVRALREIGLTPHIAQNDTHRRSALDGRTTRHPGHAVSLRIRKLIETRIGWLQEIGLMRKPKYRGGMRVDERLKLAATAFNLLHLANLLRVAPV